MHDFLRGTPIATLSPAPRTEGITVCIQLVPNLHCRIMPGTYLIKVHSRHATPTARASNGLQLRTGTSNRGLETSGKVTERARRLGSSFRRSLRVPVARKRRIPVPT